MAIAGKLTKLKSVLKKMQSFKLGRANGSLVAAASNSASDEETNANFSNCDSFKDLRPVFVGKSRRRYLVSSEVAEHPLVRELVDRSSDGSNDGSIAISCEVVLFEHLLWMLENADPQPESPDELVEFYAC